ncbi:MAG: co-chaperone DjlA [Gammaproteobacteria bacterium]
MSWWGKALGGTFGFLLGGPLGALLGAALGHQLDQKAATTGLLGGGGMDIGSQQRVQAVFFMATFSVMGHVAKADGRVSEDEIEAARAVMARLGLNPQLRQAAMRLFTQGKQPDFPLDDVLRQFKQECQRRRTLLQLFMEFLLMAAYADGVMHAAERRLLLHVSSRLGFSAAEFERLEAMVRAGRHFEQGQRPRAQAARVSLADAYAVLSVAPEASDEQIKTVYRRLLSQHHPDKLVAKGLPEEMMKIASERTHQIRSAYEVIREKRGF